MKLPLILIVTLFINSSVFALENSTPTESVNKQQVAKKLIKDFAGSLKLKLQEALKQGGPVKGIEVCKIEAPKIAEQYSTKGWTIKRTSLKLRNLSNQPDDIELAVLKEFEALSTLQVKRPLTKELSNDNGEYRFMTEIQTKGLCLTCHGDNLPKEVEIALQKHYPEDRAIDFKLNDIRGIFSVTYKNEN